MSCESTRPHLWLDDRCERCGMRQGWPGAGDLCRGAILPRERRQRYLTLLSRGMRSRIRSAVAMRIGRDRITPFESPRLVREFALGDEDSTSAIENIADPGPLPDEQLIAAERARWVDRYFEISETPCEERRRIYARWNLGAQR